MNRAVPAAALAFALCSPLAALSDMSKADTERFRDLARASLAEVEAGELARERAAHPAVKDLGKDMVEDHGRMLERHRALAKKEGVRLPGEPGSAQQQAIRELREKPRRGFEFDHAYMARTVKDHEAALRLAQDTAKRAKDAQLRAAAEKAVPEIRKRLEQARTLQLGMKNLAASQDPP